MRNLVSLDFFFFFFVIFPLWISFFTWCLYVRYYKDKMINSKENNSLPWLSWKICVYSSWPVTLCQGSIILQGIVTNICKHFRLSLASLLAQMVKNLPVMLETWVQSLGWEDPLEQVMATHSNILTCRIPWTEEPGRLQSMGSQRVGHNWATFTSLGCHKWSSSTGN